MTRGEFLARAARLGLLGAAGLSGLAGSACAGAVRRPDRPEYFGRECVDSRPLELIHEKVARGRFLNFEELSLLSGNEELAARLAGVYAVDHRALVSRIQTPTHTFRGNPEHQEFCFTFDCGAESGRIEAILDSLDRLGVRTTFFVTGEFIDRYPRIVGRMAEQQHEIANHSDTHPQFRSAAHMEAELARARDKFKKLTGRHFAPYFRAPFFQEMGKPWIVREALRLGYVSINTTLAANDWAGESHPGFVPAGFFASKFPYLDFDRLGLNSGRKRVVVLTRGSLGRVRVGRELNVNGGIMIMHAMTYRRGRPISSTLDELIPSMRKSGYAIVTLSELLNERAADPRPGCYKTYRDTGLKRAGRA